MNNLDYKLMLEREIETYERMTKEDLSDELNAYFNGMLSASRIHYNIFLMLDNEDK